jgi:hypothetical protein
MSEQPIPKEELFDRLRRSSTRYQFRIQAELVWQSRRSWSRVVDISRGGMFIEMDAPFRVNAMFIAYLALNVPLQLNCRVRRVVPGRGIGVSLTVPCDMKNRFEALMLALAFGSDSGSQRAVPSSEGAGVRPMARAAVASGLR